MLSTHGEGVREVGPITSKRNPIMVLPHIPTTHDGEGRRNVGPHSGGAIMGVQEPHIGVRQHGPSNSVLEALGKKAPDNHMRGSLALALQIGYTGSSSERTSSSTGKSET
jgi:hypothetical protein